MKKIFSLIVALLALCQFAQANTYKVGTAANYPPFEFINDTKISGFDIDLITEVAKRVGFEITFVNMSFDGLIPALKGGKIDFIASAMSATDDRRKSVDFSNSYYMTENLFLKKKDNKQMTSKDNLVGKKVGVQLGTVQELAAKQLKDVKVVPSEEIVSVILSLKAGKIDAVLVDSSIGYGFLKKNDDLSEFLKEPDGSEGFSFAFDKDKHKELITKINNAVDQIKKDGTFDKLLEKYDLK